MSDEPAHNYFVVTDPNKIDMQWLMDEIRLTYFGKTRTEGEMTECIRNSLVFAVFRRDYLPEGFPSHRDRMVAFARVLSDGVLVGWVCDFLVGEKERGRGIGFRLMDEILRHHAVKGLTLNLCTRDAQEFYRKFNFVDGAHMLRRPAP